MTKQIASLFFMLACATAQADQQQVKYVQDTVDGQRAVVAIGSCSFPAQDYSGNLISTGSYTVCQEKITSQYKVTGSGWNSSREVVPGTSRSSYVLEQKEVHGMVYVQSNNSQSQQDATIAILNDAMALASAKSQCNDQLRNLSGLRMHVSQTACSGK